MRRILSWIVLILGYVAFGLVLALDLTIMDYFFELYDTLSAFLKLIILIIGSSFVFGLAITPLVYGIPLVHSASESICPSKKGVRYFCIGIFAVATVIINTIYSGFYLSGIFYAIFGISFIVIGYSTMKDAVDNY